MFCSNCGTQLNPGAEFCARCGAKVVVAGAAVPGAPPSPAAPPAAPVTAEAPPAVAPPMLAARWSITGCLRAGWSAFGRRPGLGLSIDLVYLALVVVQLVPIAGALAVILLQPPALGGIARLSLNMVDDRRPVADDLVSGFRRLLSFVGLYLLVAVIVVACMIPSMGAGVFFALTHMGGASWLAALAVLIVANLLVVAYLAVRWMFAVFLLSDVEGIGILDTLRASWDLTRGQFWRLLGLLLLLFGVMVLGLICLLVGYLVALPVCWLALAAAYRARRPLPPAAEPAVAAASAPA